MPLEKTISWLKRKNKKCYDIYFKKRYEENYKAYRI